MKKCINIQVSTIHSMPTKACYQEFGESDPVNFSYMRNISIINYKIHIEFTHESRLTVESIHNLGKLSPMVFTEYKIIHIIYTPDFTEIERIEILKFLYNTDRTLVREISTDLLKDYEIYSGVVPAIDIKLPKIDINIHDEVWYSEDSGTGRLE